MGLVNSTGFFQYIPPVPAIKSLSTNTAELGDKVIVYGENLDYIDRLKFAGEVLNFNLVDENNLEFVVPDNPSTGLLTIETDGVNIKQKELPFLPIFKIDSISPIFGPSGETVTVNGKVLNSIISGDILANPIDSDLNYQFLNEDFNKKSVYAFVTFTPLFGFFPPVQTGVITGFIYGTGIKNECRIKGSLNSGLQVVFHEYICKKSESGNYVLREISDYTANSGYVSTINFETDYGLQSTSLFQDSYELHSFNFPKINDNYIKSDRVKITDKTNVQVNFISGFEDTGYGVFYNIIFSGSGRTDGYLSQSIFGTTYDKTPSGFRIQLFDSIPYDLDLDYIAIRYGTGIYDSGFYRCNTIPLSVKTGEQINNIVYFENNKEYFPFLATSLYKLYPTGYAYVDNSGVILPLDSNPLSSGFNDYARFLNLNSAFFGKSIYNVKNNSFNVDTSMIDNTTPTFSPTGYIYVDYLLIDNPSADLNTFIYDGTGSYYKKTILFTGDASTFQKRVPIKNIKAKNKNNLTFEVPYTNYHINGKLILRNSNLLEKRSDEIFLETPYPENVEPNELYRGMPFLLKGKSFKKPILIDGTGYNKIIVRFDYQEQLFTQKNNDFEMNMTLLDVNTLSGNIPVGNLPSGNYKIQMIDENRKIYE